MKFHHAVGGIAKHMPVWSWALCLTVVLPTAEAHIYAGWDGTTGSWTDVARWSTNPVYPDNGHPDAGNTYAVNISGGTVTRNTLATMQSPAVRGFTDRRRS